MLGLLVSIEFNLVILGQYVNFVEICPPSVRAHAHISNDRNLANFMTLVFSSFWSILLHLYNSFSSNYVSYGEIVACIQQLIQREQCTAMDWTRTCSSHFSWKASPLTRSKLIHWEVFLIFLPNLVPLSLKWFQSKNWWLIRNSPDVILYLFI